MTEPTRYVSDVPYVPGFTCELSPEWLDFVAVLCGFEPPGRASDFAWCELGCGQGLTSIVFAATHPEGMFHAVDAMPAHIAWGRRVAADAGIGNLAFHAVDFAAAVELDLPQFAYIVAHGVYSWIDEEAKAAFRRFIGRHLAPGGLVYVSYNTMPGWAADAPFQHLVRAIAARETGDSMDRFDAAAAAVQGLTRAGAPALTASSVAAGWDAEKERRPRAYFAHEYLAPAWRPLYVDDVRRDMAQIGLEPVGSATLRDNFDGFVLRRAAREALEAIADADLRDLVRDYFLLQRFRRDVYGRAPAGLDDDERRERLFAMPFALVTPAALVEYAMATEAGRVTYDNPVARRIVSMLAHEPRTLADCLTGPDRTQAPAAQDLLANALALCCAGTIAPVSRGRADVAGLNALLLEDAGPGTAYRVLPFGTAQKFDTRFLVALRDGKEVAPEVRPWADHLLRWA